MRIADLAPGLALSMALFLIAGATDAQAQATIGQAWEGSYSCLGSGEADLRLELTDTTGATFLRQENIEYTESTGFSSPYGTSPDQTTFSPISAVKAGGAPGANTNLAKLLTDGSNTVNKTVSPHGTNYLLMSAGEDRIYGTSDDILINH